MQVCIKPCHIYPQYTKQAIDKYLKENMLRVIDFRAAKKGETYLAATDPLRFMMADVSHKEAFPRLILEKVPDTVDINTQVATIAPFQLYYGEDQNSLETYLKNSGRVLVGFYTPTKVTEVFIQLAHFGKFGSIQCILNPLVNTPRLIVSKISEDINYWE